ncbi:hypothetical protein HYR99_09065 [Candidatus Poribacteria bacterium]|nr:hypothetical protein [Candidatus Poribacteria bacterium]
MITTINRTPVHSMLASDGVHFNKQDLYEAFHLPHDDLSDDGTLTAQEVLDLFLKTLDSEHPDCEAIDVWLRDAIDAHHAREFYPPETHVGFIVAYWERVAWYVTGKTPQELLDEAKAHGFDVQSWHDALRHLDYPLSCAVSDHAFLTTNGMNNDEATQLVLSRIPFYRRDYERHPTPVKQVGEMSV